MDIEKELKLAAERTELGLDSYLSVSRSGETLLRDAMRYSALGGGKRIRAFLVLSTAEAFGAKWETALSFACAMEMVHAYSLIHDDLPCMDNDDIRRGKPSCHIRFDEANALLAGDALLTQAFEVLASASEVSESSKCEAVCTLSHCAGPLGMAGGQFYDLAESCGTLDELLRMESMKTGALIRAAVQLGYYSAEGKDKKVIADLADYADGIGKTFQIVDDLLDVYGDVSVLGKPVGSDVKNGKKTILSFVTPEDAVSLARKYTEKAKQALSSYPNCGKLTALAEFLLSRKK